MSTKLKATVTVEVPGMGKITDRHEVEVEAFDRIEVEVPAASGSAGELVVEVQPGGAGQVLLLLITADSYGDDLSYSVTGGTADVTVDGPQLLVGSGAVALLGTTQNTITFSNNAAEAIGVQILVGRDATTPTP